MRGAALANAAAATATADAEHAPSQGRNDGRPVHSRADHGVVGQPQARASTKGSATLASKAIAT